MWAAYAKLDKAKVRGVGKERLLTDLVALVRYALQQTDILYPFADQVNENFNHWLEEQAGKNLMMSKCVGWKISATHRRQFTHSAG